MKKIKLLLVEDEEVLSMVIKDTLETKGFEVDVAFNGVDGWVRFNRSKPDICILDIMLPQKDGLSLLSDIRLVDRDIPIIILTARTQNHDLIKGFEIGADDYMKKPFSIEELIVRLKSLLRRSLKTTVTPQEKRVDIFQIGQYNFDYKRLELIHDTKTIILSQREADVLQLLAQSKNELLDKHYALTKIWNDDNIFNSRNMDVYITRLRKYLSLDKRLGIVNVRGKGYKLLE